MPKHGLEHTKYDIAKNPSQNIYKILNRDKKFNTVINGEVTLSLNRNKDMEEIQKKKGYVHF